MYRKIKIHVSPGRRDAVNHSQTGPDLGYPAAVGATHSYAREGCRVKIEGIANLNASQDWRNCSAAGRSTSKMAEYERQLREQLAANRESGAAPLTCVDYSRD